MNNIFKSKTAFVLIVIYVIFTLTVLSMSTDRGGYNLASELLLPIPVMSVNLIGIDPNSLHYTSIENKLWTEKISGLYFVVVVINSFLIYALSVFIKFVGSLFLKKNPQKDFEA